MGTQPWASRASEVSLSQVSSGGKSTEGLHRDLHTSRPLENGWQCYGKHPSPICLEEGLGALLLTRDRVKWTVGSEPQASPAFPSFVAQQRHWISVVTASLPYEMNKSTLIVLIVHLTVWKHRASGHTCERFS